jgi:hypothetical protein
MARKLLIHEVIDRRFWGVTSLVIALLIKSYCFILKNRNYPLSLQAVYEQQVFVHKR